jgi:hypothetical protein
MAEWLKALPWKTNPASCIEGYRNISSRNRFNDFPPQNASQCEPVNVAVCQSFGATLHSFYTVLTGTSGVLPDSRWCVLSLKRSGL